MRILIFSKISGSVYFVGLTVRVYQELLYGQHTTNRWYVDKKMGSLLIVWACVQLRYSIVIRHGHECRKLIFLKSIAITGCNRETVTRDWTIAQD